MKFGVSRYELFALTSHLVGLPSPNPEYGRRRLRAWDQLGVAALAEDLAFASAGLGTVEIKITDWSDKTKRTEVELGPDVVDYLIAGTGMQTAGIWADALARLRDRLEKAKAGT